MQSDSTGGTVVQFPIPNSKPTRKARACHKSASVTPVFAPILSLDEHAQLLDKPFNTVGAGMALSCLLHDGRDLVGIMKRLRTMKFPFGKNNGVDTVVAAAASFRTEAEYLCKLACLAEERAKLLAELT
jgi:hypothetical protein